MVRPTLQLHAARTPATPRPAATLLWLRDSAAGPEVLLTRRSPTASFLPGVFVFPGGRIDAEDAGALDLVHGAAAGHPAEGLTPALAALRESFEELGILHAVRDDGGPLTHRDIASLRRDQALYPQLRAHRLKLAATEVRTLARWTTDRDVGPRRFDTAFLIARIPAGQTAVADDAEQFEPVWLRAEDALQRHQGGTLPLIFPTLRTLRWLAPFRDVDAALQACASGRPLWESCPRGALVKGQPQRYMEHDLPFGELEMVCPDGQLEHALDWQHERPVQLLRHLWRLTAPNRGVMTGPGTNSYIIGSAAGGFVVIDPGPPDDEHVARLFGATEGNIRAILCTHSHPDHSPGAKPLAQLCADRTGRRPPILGMASAPTARDHSLFVPDRELGDGERVHLADPEHPVTLRAIHTPGHAANHLCLVVEEDGLLFSGDHVLNGSTTIIDPPDGNMAAYLDSLDALSAACGGDAIRFILPAHGHVMGSAADTIARLKAHRLGREAKVIAAMRAKPEGESEDWVALAYADTPRNLWPMAKRSLLAHVERIRALDLAS
jgi:glyoxylase-like metal-dependent hydrolase (beta-lactamase superfamily II)/8-oxo-dGTP pyrophosphatase MutT (NUDIX family)